MCSEALAPPPTVYLSRPRPFGRRSEWLPCKKIGRGSPNTVSPMLERWFVSLGQRFVGMSAGATPAGNNADSMPVSMRNATRLLWETARREAEQVQRLELEAEPAEVCANEEGLRRGQAELAQREAAFEPARASLDAVLAASQQRARHWNGSWQSRRRRRCTSV